MRSFYSTSLLAARSFPGSRQFKTSSANRSQKNRKAVERGKNRKSVDKCNKHMLKAIQKEQQPLGGPKRATTSETTAHITRDFNHSGELEKKHSVSKIIEQLTQWRNNMRHSYTVR